MNRVVLPGLLALLVLSCSGPPPVEPVASPEAAEPGSEEALVARAKSFEIKTEYTPPPGDALEHHTAGFAKTLCSAVFITGLDPDFAAENVGLAVEAATAGNARNDVNRYAANLSRHRGGS